MNERHNDVIDVIIQKSQLKHETKIYYVINFKTNKKTCKKSKIGLLRF